MMSLTFLIRSGEKAKAAREESILQSQNEAAAGNAYSQPDPTQLGPDNGHSGLPWGGVSIRHVVELGQSREQSRHRTLEMSSYDIPVRRQPRPQEPSPHHPFELPSRHRGSANPYSSESRTGRESTSRTHDSNRGHDKHDTRHVLESNRSRHETSKPHHRTDDYFHPDTRNHRSDGRR
jgi:hypothetical protein